MFTGIITDLGRVKRVRRGDLADLTITTAFDTSAIALEASIACSGACLTVIATEAGEFLVQASAQAPARTRRGSAMHRPPHLLLVEAPYYTHSADHLRKGAERAMAAAGATHEVISVPGAFEIPAAIGMVARSTGRFDGFVALGCVIRGETTHYDHICAGSARGLQGLAVPQGPVTGV